MNRNLIFFNTEITPIRKLLLMHLAAGGKLTEYTVTGNPVSFTTDVQKALTECLVSFSPVQSGSGDPSPENVRPITGWTGAKVYRTGKNLINTAEFTDGKVWYNGNMISGYSQYSASPKIPVVPGATYFLTRSSMSQNQVCFFDHAGDYISQSSWTANSAKIMGDGVYFIGFAILATDKETAQLEVGSSATAYEAYTVTSVSVTFPEEAGTVYGGTLDLTTGVLTVSHVAKIVRGTDAFYASNSYIKSDAFDAFIYLSNPYGGIGICNILTRSNAGIWGDVGYPNTFRINANQLHINIANDLLGITDYTQETVSTATQKMKSYIEELYENETPLTVVYPVSTQQTYHLTPTEIQTLIGTNVLWSDTNGDMEVKYLKKG